MILDSALASICWWSCYHSSQFIVSIKSALNNWTIGSISHHCISILTFTIQNAKNVLSTLAASHICFLSSTVIVHFPQTIVMIVTLALALSLCISISSIFVRFYFSKTKSACQYIVIICTEIVIKINDCSLSCCSIDLIDIFTY